MSRYLVPFRLSVDIVFWKKFLQLSLPVGMISIVSFAYFKMDTILLSVLQGSSDVGIYNAAYKIIENLTFFPAMIAGLVLPLFSRYIFSEPEKFRLVANKTFKVFAASVTPLVVGGFLLAEPLVLLLGGEEFQTAALPLRILIFSLGAIFFGNFFNAILIAGNLQKRLLAVLFVIALLNITLNIFLIPIFSFMGAAAVSLATEATVAIATAILSFRFLGYFPASEGLVGILLSSAIMGIFLTFFSHLSLPILLVSAIILYIATLSLTGSVKKEEIILLFSRKGDDSENTLTPSI